MLREGKGQFLPLWGMRSSFTSRCPKDRGGKRQSILVTTKTFTCKGRLYPEASHDVDKEQADWRLGYGWALGMPYEWIDVGVNMLFKHKFQDTHISGAAEYGYHVISIDVTVHPPT